MFVDLELEFVPNCELHCGEKTSVVLFDPDFLDFFKTDLENIIARIDSDGGIASVRKRVTGFLSVRTLDGLSASQKQCAKSRNAMYKANLFRDFFDLLSRN